MRLKGSFKKKNRVKVFNKVAIDNKRAALDTAVNLFVLEITK